MQTVSVSSPFQVELSFFSGPLDLLLHLVRRAEVPIAEVKMSVIADQYLEIIEKAAEFDIDLATEYLVVAATLLAIKSESLLPGGGLGEPGEDDFEEGSDFYEQLRERLRRYEETKNRAQQLLARPQLGLTTFARVDRQFLVGTQELITNEKDLQTLPMLFVGLLKRIGKKIEGFVVRLDPIPLVDFMMRVVDAVQGIVSPGNMNQHLGENVVAGPGLIAGTGVGSGAAEPPRSFRSLLVNLFQQARAKLPLSPPSLHGSDSGSVSPTSDQVVATKQATKQLSKGTIIGSFMAVLELVKRGIIAVKQDDDRGDIEISMRMHHVESDQILHGDLVENAAGESVEFFENAPSVANA